MKRRRVVLVIALLFSIASVPLRPGAQDATDQLKERAAQDTIRISVEGVRIPVLAQDQYGHFYPAVELADLTVRENGVLQRITSLYRVPASVVLLLDTGGELNPAKVVTVTEGVAAQLLTTLHPEDQLAVLEASEKVETLQDWTSVARLPSGFPVDRLFASKRSSLVKALDKSLLLLSSTPAGNRHLVMVTDGIGEGGTKVDIDAASARLIASDIAVHVISFTALGLASAKPPMARRREKAKVPEETTMSLPRTKRPENSVDLLKDVPNMKGGIELDIDRAMGLRKDIKMDLKQSENELAALAHDTGGKIWLPESLERMFRDAQDLAREIDSQYVLTYKPAILKGSETHEKFRKIDVVSRKVGLIVRARRFYKVLIP